jgi:ankyrin repeat protein
MIEYLINKGVHVGSLALIVAARSGNLDVTRLLVEAGADIDFQQRWGHTALMTAAKNGHLDVVKFLMERGTNLFLKDKNGDTAIIIATENDHAEIATMLKQAGAKYKARPNKETKIQPAAEIEDDEDLELIDTPDVEDLPADEEVDELEDED